MAFEWSQFVELAEKLIGYGEGTGLESAYYRSAVSRSYYGVFCIARDKVEEILGYSVPPRDSHRFVIYKFTYSSTNITRKIGKDLDSLHKKRQKADYTNPEDIDITQAQKALEIAKRTLKNYEDTNLKIDAR